MRISEAFESYRSVLVFKNMSKKTEGSYVVACRHTTAFFGDIPIESLTFEMVRLFKLALDKGRSPDTVRGYIICIRTVLRHCQSLGMKVIDPDSIPVPKRSQKIPSFITAKEVANLIEVAGKPARGYPASNRLRNQAIISLLYASGIRASELCGLDRYNIKNRYFTIVGKGGKARLCFIDKRTEKLINQYLSIRKDSSPAMFICHQNGQRLRSGGLQALFRDLSQRANLTTPVHPHTLRHSFATNLLQNNANMRYLQEMMGHSSLATTQMYTHVCNPDLQKIYDECHTT